MIRQLRQLLNNGKFHVQQFIVILNKLEDEKSDK